MRDKFSQHLLLRALEHTLLHKMARKGVPILLYLGILWQLRQQHYLNHCSVKNSVSHKQILKLLYNSVQC